MTSKIEQLIINTLHNGKSGKRLNGESLFSYLIGAEVSIDDNVIDLIDDKKSIKNQPKAVIDAFAPFAKDVTVSKKETEKQKSIRIISNICKEELVPFSTLSYRNIDYVSKRKKVTGRDYSLFSKPIEDWEEQDYQKLNNTFLKGL